jgi:hypothetical protein
MIRWLEDERLSKAVKANMARFKSTSFAKDLDESEARWRFMSWPRTDDMPMRFLLESDDQQHATFTIDDGGLEYGKIELQRVHELIDRG